ncbi:unnamed protein product, partial [Oppiella nova]
AVAKLGATLVTLFPNLGDEGLVHGINQTEVQLAIVSCDLMPTIGRLSARLPTLRTVVYIDHKNAAKVVTDSHINGFPDTIRLISLRDVETTGAQLPDTPFKTPHPDDPFLIMYTSGTTGAPKAAIATHRQMMEGSARALLSVCSWMGGARSHTYVAFLPLAHILELTQEFVYFYIGIRIGYSSPFTLTDTAPGLARGQVSDIKLLQPTIMTTVPLVLDKLLKEVGDKLEARSQILVNLFGYLIDYKTKWTRLGYRCPIVNHVVCSKVREQLGGRLKIVIAGGAPLNPNTQSHIKALLDVILAQGYGATETLGMDSGDLSYGRVGGPLSGVKLRLTDWNEGGYHPSDTPHPRGEIVIGGQSVVTGYYGSPDETRVAFRVDSRGVRWFHTGDIGELYPDGTVRIVDRKKDLHKLQNGEYVSLGKIEAALKSCPHVDNACVCWRVNAPYLTALISPNRKRVLKLSHDLGLNGVLMEDIVGNETVNRRVFEAVVQTGREAGLGTKEIPVRIALVADEWTPDNDLLTAAMKLKRRNVEKRYHKEIDGLFTKDGVLVNDGDNTLRALAGYELIGQYSHKL